MMGTCLVQGTVEEVSSAVVWLLSPGARYVSGSTVTVDAALSNVKASISTSLKLACASTWSGTPRPAWLPLLALLPR